MRIAIKSCFISPKKPYGFVNEAYVQNLIDSNAEIEAERHGINYYKDNAGNLIHIYNAFELPENNPCNAQNNVRE